MWIKNIKELLQVNPEKRKPLLGAFSEAITKLELTSYDQRLEGLASAKRKDEIIENNEIACRAMIDFVAQNDGRPSYYLGPSVEGNAVDVAKNIGELLKEISRGKGEIKPPCYVVFGQKDLSVTMEGARGYGGKTLLQGLLLGLELKGDYKISILCGKTNGIDGTSKAAAVLFDDEVYTRTTRGINFESYIKSNDSAILLNQGRGLVVTGRMKAPKARVGIAMVN